MNATLVDVGVATLRRSMFPWFVLASLIALTGAGGSGMYFGYEIATGRYAKDKLELVSAQNAALAEKEARRQEAESRSRLVEENFITALRDVTGMNAEQSKKMKEELKKEIYIACKVPDSGVDLINSHVDDVNLRIMSRGEK